MAVIMAAASAGCLFTDPINMPPNVKIIASADILRGRSVTFTADVSDPNGDAVEVEWAVGCVSGPEAGAGCDPCPTGLNAYLIPARWPAPDQKGVREFVVDVSDTAGPFCVWAFGTDRHGARRPAVPFAARPSNRAPRPAIDVVSADPEPFPLYSEIEFSGRGSTDADSADALTFAWQYTGPLPSMETRPLTFCKAAQTPSSMCLTPDRPGRYLIALTVGDGLATETLAHEIVVAPDRLPCLASTKPPVGVDLLGQELKTLPFEVLRVDDDGEWYPENPGERVRFDWFVGGAAGALTYQPQHDFPAFELAPTYQPGDEVLVRVEIHDRNVQAIDDILFGCGDRAICGRAPGCPQRVTWKIQYR